MTGGVTFYTSFEVQPVTTIMFRWSALRGGEALRACCIMLTLEGPSARSSVHRWEREFTRTCWVSSPETAACWIRLCDASMVCCCHLSCMLRGMNTLFTCFTGFNFRPLHWITEETNTAHLFHSDSENLSSLLFKAWRNVQQLFKDRQKVSSSQFAPAACFKATFTLRPSQTHEASLGMQTEKFHVESYVSR